MDREKEFEIIETKNEKLINIAKEYMNQVEDVKHSKLHMEAVVNYVKEILKVEKNANAEVCIISAYWHDVGRIYGEKEHHKKSAEMIEKQMEEFNYDKTLINKCVKAIEKHSWSEMPETLEGIIVRDADKIEFVGLSRWKVCIESNCRFKKILDRLPKLRNDILQLDISREIYDKEVAKLIKYLHNVIFKIEE